MKKYKNLAEKNVFYIKKTNGITLVALVLSIVVVLILAGVTLNATVGENGILSKTRKASITQRFATYKEATEMIMDQGITIAGNEIKNYLPSITTEDIDKFAIVSGNLSYLGDNQEEVSVANDLKIATSENSSVEDIIKIKNEVLNLGDGVELPFNDNEPTPTNLLGTRLYDKNSINGERWNLIITYDNNNKEITRYGSGYYYLTPENTTTLGLTGSYVVNYTSKQLMGLGNYKNWNINSSLAVSDGLVLNIDPTNVADGNWEGITKHGDVEYNSSDKALLFNESSSNTAGEGGYLETTRKGIDFTNGFTFEMYANLTRLSYDNGSKIKGNGLFCRMPTLTSTYTQAMRFFGQSYGQSNNVKYICKFNGSSSWQGNVNVLSTNSSGDISASNIGYNTNEDFYLTFVYVTFDKNQISELYDDYMIKNQVDKVYYYINRRKVWLHISWT